MNAIDFVVRTRAGAVTRGSVGGEGEGFLIDAGSGNQISLNLHRADVQNYDRAGSDLLVTLADGRVVVLEGYFAGGAEGVNQLYLSADNVLHEVSFVDTGSGGLFAQYADAASWGKWSPSDDLMFYERPAVVAEVYDSEDEVSMLAPGLLGTGLASGLGAAGLGGAALLGLASRGNGGGDDGDSWTPPTVDNADVPIVVGGTEDPVIDVSGTGNTDSEVEVIIGSATGQVVAGEDRTWRVTFQGDEFPEDGVYEDITVVVTDPDGTVTELTGPDITIDLTPPIIEVVDGTVSVGDIVNAEDYKDGVTVSGTGEVGATVQINVGDYSESAVIDETGSWSFTFDSSVVVEGEYITEITITATDAFGNSTVVTDALDIDTVPHPLVIDPVGPDNLVNGAEADAGFQITGSSTAGATVIVTFAETSYETVVAEDGTWSVSVTSEDFAGGEYTADIAASTVDRAGNTSHTTSTVEIDTVGAVEITGTPLTGDDIFNAVELSGGVTLTGTSQAGSTVMVEIDGFAQEATVSADGSWTVTFTDLPEGSYDTTATVTATDTAGNVTTASHSFTVDTESAVTIDTPVGGDDVFNAEEFAGGVTLTGSTEPGSTVMVEVEGLSQEATVTADGSWTVTFAGLATGTYSTGATVTATDAVGNSSTTSHSFSVDTEISVSLDGPIAVDDVVNASEAAAGYSLTGSAEPGSAITVDVDGSSYTATADADGIWSVSVPTGDIRTGTYSTGIAVTAVDAAGNTASATGTLNVDTQTSVALSTDPVEGDGVVNAAEQSDGITLTGTAEAGATVDVTLGTTTHAATVDDAGNWSVSFSAAEVPTGEVTVPVTATATDAAGNTASTTGEVVVDTLVRNFASTSTPGGADGVMNAEEVAQGLTLTGTTEPGATVTVTLDGVAQAATVDAAGNWTVTYDASDLPTGEQTVSMVVSSTDAAGNTETLEQSVTVDTVAGTLTISPAPVEGDDVVNEAEASDGVVITGTSEPGQMVEVTMDGVTHTVQTAANGIWTANYAASEITPGTHTAEITATITDAAGNTLTRTDSVEIDTEVVNFSISDAPVETDDVINAVEASDGVTLTGTTEPGGTVSVEFGGSTQQATVGAMGNWTVTFASIPDGQYDATATVSTTDPAGNTAVLTRTVEVDTYVDRLETDGTPIAGDGVINAAETASGVTLSGMVEAGSSVTVTIGGIGHAASVNAAGQWSVAIPSGSIPTGDTEATFVIQATDAAGNTADITETVQIDTVAPENPNVESYTRDHTGLRGITLETGEGEIAIGHVTDETGALIDDVAFTSYDIPALGETAYAFNEVVPDGSHLVVTATDAAGNSSGTYLVVDDTTTSEVAMTGQLANALSSFNIETIDLQFAEESHLTITEAQLTALSSNTDTLTVTGGSDDQITITGAAPTGNEDGFNTFTLGDATVRIEDDITNVVI